MKHNDARNGNRNKIYNIHQAMKQRCLNKNCYCFNRYGGRNISICEEWMDYTVFKKWCMENGYNECLDLDRIDNDGNYEPSNCRFISHQDNCYNRNNNVIITIDKKPYNIKELCEKYNLTKTCILTRYERGDKNERLVRPQQNRNYNPVKSSH